MLARQKGYQDNYDGLVHVYNVKCKDLIGKMLKSVACLILF